MKFPYALLNIVVKQLPIIILNSKKLLRYLKKARETGTQLAGVQEANLDWSGKLCVNIGNIVCNYKV